MTSIAIRAVQLGKRYRIGATSTRGRFRYKRFTETLSDAVVNTLRQIRKPNAKLARSHIWALKNVSFEINHGEVVGIIGRNGAGKSTLLKLLARITEPTEGYARVRGRLGSLLEVGTGFHPELTGRENIYLSGAILGMRKAEIDRKFDEIVAFSEIEKFLDTPAKRYSSGMYVRLAFAVAAHLEPEILLVDEVLAVGDVAFQKKCLGKMDQVAGEGRTVLFVSHNMHAITRLCPRAILLDNGRLVRDGVAAEVTSAYLRDAVEAGGTRSWSLEAAPGTDELRIMEVGLLGKDGTPTSVVEVREPLTLRIRYHVGRPNLRFRCVAVFYMQGICAFTSIEPTEEKREAIGTYYSTLRIPPNLLTDGEYSITIGMIAIRGKKRRYADIKDAGVGARAPPTWVSPDGYRKYLRSGDFIAHHGPSYFMAFVAFSEFFTSVFTGWHLADSRHLAN